MSHFWNLLDPPSLFRYVRWRASHGRRPVELSLRKGGRLLMRPKPATDYGVAYEVFFHEVYRPPFALDARKIRLIVDLGANVGYSCLYWCREYPVATVIAYEPHPQHVALAQRTLSHSGFSTRVKLIAAAAGCATGQLVLSDAGSSSSSVIPNHGRHSVLRVPCEDVFAQLQGLPVDLLKIDIEGGEYDILNDPRFARLAPQIVVLEWHACPGQPEPERWCLDRLRAMRYTAQVKESAGTHGLIWAFRDTAPLLHVDTAGDGRKAIASCAS